MSEEKLVRDGFVADPHARLEVGLEKSWEDLGGQFTVGAGLETEALLAAGIETADVFIASTDGDNTNIVIAQIAQQRYDEADKLHCALREADEDEGLYDPPKIHLYTYERKEIETILMTAEEWHTRWKPTGEMVPVFASVPKDIIPSETMKGLSKSQRAYWVRKKKLELSRAEEARAARLKGLASHAAWEKMNDTDKALRGITERLVRTQPATIGGAAVVLKHLADFAVDHDDQFGSDEYAVDFMGNIADALAKIAA
jgi:hypothetical protein